VGVGGGNIGVAGGSVGVDEATGVANCCCSSGAGEGVKVSSSIVIAGAGRLVGAVVSGGGVGVSPSWQAMSARSENKSRENRININCDALY
jgi:hypothetical protein